MTATLRKIVKFTLAAVIYYSGFLALYSIIKRIITPQGSLIILMYHRVLDDSSRDKEYGQSGISISQNSFKQQMSFLTKHYKPISLESLIYLLRNDRLPPKKSVVITFDDGWLDNYQNAYPVLKKHRIPATIFLSTDFIDTDKLFWFLQINILLTEGNISPITLINIVKRVNEMNERNKSVKNLIWQELNRTGTNVDKFMEIVKKLDSKTIQKLIDEMIKESDISFNHWAERRWVLSWNEANEMAQNGIDFGSHSCSHRILTLLNSSEVMEELTRSKNIIEEKIGKKIESFSYPNGDYNVEIKEMVREAGYLCATATAGCERSSKDLDLFALKRIGIHEGATLGPTGRFSKAIFACHLEKLF